MFAFVIMPSHIHFIAKVENDGNLSDVLRDFKSFTAKRIIQLIEESDKESRKEWLLYMFEFFGKKQAHNKKYQFWQQNNHAFDLFSNKFIDQKVDYLSADRQAYITTLLRQEWCKSRINIFIAVLMNLLI